MTVYRKDYTPPAFIITKTELSFLLDEKKTLVTSKLHVMRSHNSTNLVLDGSKDMKLKSIYLDGKRLSPTQYNLTSTTLEVLKVPDNFVLEIENEINPSANTQLEGLYRDSNGLLCTQCEAQGFRSITYYIDRPDMLSEFYVRLIADKKKYPVLLSNGNLIEEKDLEDGLHLSYWHDPIPKPPHIFALVAGALVWIEDEFVTMSDKKVELKIYAEKHNIDKCPFGMKCLKEAMLWDEQKYGREYDLTKFNIVAVDAFNAGAMENKGLNIYNSSAILTSPETTTDDRYLYVQRVIAHEYFHNWTGNRVSLRSWFELSLKEGFTVYRDTQFSADMTSFDVRTIREARDLRATQFDEDSGPLAHPVRPDEYEEIRNFYTRTVYEKGAQVIGMMNTILGDKKFRKATDYYFEKHDGDAATCDDLVSAMEAIDSSVVNWDQFKLWYSQSGTPYVNVESTYDESHQKLTLKVEQSCKPTPGQKNKKPFCIPLGIAFFDQEGKKLSVKLQKKNSYNAEEKILLVDKDVEEFVFEGVKEKPLLSLLRKFSAPIVVNYNYTPEELLALAKYDDDGFARTEAIQRLCLYDIERLLRKTDGSLSYTIKSYEKFLQDVISAEGEEYDFDLAHEMLALPLEDYIFDLYHKEFTLDEVADTYKSIRKTLGTKFYNEFNKIFSNLNRITDDVDPIKNVGMHKLRNLCLGFMAAADFNKAQDIIISHYTNATNMTDEIFALRLITKYGAADNSKEYLDKFFQKWKDVPNTLDMWFSIQASSTKEGGIDRVNALIQHEKYNPLRPNSLRAVIGVFSGSGPHNFHNKSGKGYKWFADKVLEIDKTNSQTAARICVPLTNWHKYDEKRQKLMRGELERIKKAKGVSNVLLEIATKGAIKL